MVKKNSKNTSKVISSPWACNKGCKVALDRHGNITCKHLEKLINVDTARTKDNTYSDINIQRFPGQVPEEKKMKFLQAIAEYGLQPWEIEFLYERFVEERSVTEIVKKLGYTSRTTGYAIYTKTLAKLKKRGFKLKHE